MRIASHVWISALKRKVANEGGFCTVINSGDASAGAIFIVERLQGGFRCWGPAPQELFDDDVPESQLAERLFECVLETANEAEVDAYLAKQRSFDPDCHIVEIENANVDLPQPKEIRKPF